MSISLGSLKRQIGKLTVYAVESVSLSETPAIVPPIKRRVGGSAKRTCPQLSPVRREKEHSPVATINKRLSEAYSGLSGDRYVMLKEDELES